MLSGSQSFVYVSGTASIKGELTVGVDDVVHQTRTTISLLEQLTAVENLNRSLNGQTISEAHWCLVRVYIKNQEDFILVRKICLDYFGEKVAMFCVQADVCRDNLLVEIEGVMSISCSN